MLSAKELLLEAANNPKIASVVGTTTASVGAFGAYNIIHGWLSIATMAVGLFTASIVAGIQLLKLIRNWKAYKNNEPEP
jgi:hypothetical protein